MGLINPGIRPRMVKKAEETAPCCLFCLTDSKRSCGDLQSCAGGMRFVVSETFWPLEANYGFHTSWPILIAGLKNIVTAAATCYVADVVCGIHV